MYDHFEAERARKKAMSAAEKKEIKAKKDEAESKYVFCTLDGRKEKVGNFRAEPPGLFRGRGEHPKKGALKVRSFISLLRWFLDRRSMEDTDVLIAVPNFKLRLYPSDITLNIGADATIPVPNIPGNWGKVIHDNTVTWLAHWKENVNGNAKYVFLAAGSSLKGQSDMQKFEKARELKVGKESHGV
jgi:DNA topoisomerase-1